MQLHPMNRREWKPLQAYIESRYDSSIKLPGTWFKSDNDDVFYFSARSLPEGKFKINSIGIYMGEWRHQEFRLSIEGAQILKPKKNFLKLTEKQAKDWMAGREIPLKQEHGFYIISHQQDILGCGKVKNNILLNFVPKSRRVSIH